MCEPINLVGPRFLILDAYHLRFAVEGKNHKASADKSGVVAEPASRARDSKW